MFSTPSTDSFVSKMLIFADPNSFIICYDQTNKRIGVKKLEEQKR